MFLSIITYTEPVFYIFIYILNGNTLKYIDRKKIADLYSENIMILAIGMAFISYDIIEGKK